MEICILSIILIRNLEVYGEEIFTTIDFNPYGIFITIEDVYHLNEEYLKNPVLAVGEADRLLNKYAMDYVDNSGIVLASDRTAYADKKCDIF